MKEKPENNDFNWEETWTGQVIKHAKDMSWHPSKKELGWSVFRPDIMNNMEPSMARIIDMHPEFCETCRDIRDSIKNEVKSRKPEFQIKPKNQDDLRE